MLTNNKGQSDIVTQNTNTELEGSYARLFTTKLLIFVELGKSQY